MDKRWRSDRLEFHEKLQQLRKQKGLTQEQLAEQLFVSRTAVSKWESGKGYPNIESLKYISKFFSITIDDLLSSEELIDLAQNENNTNLNKIYEFLIGTLDVLAIMFFVLPFYGHSKDGYIYSVNLFQFKDTTFVNLVFYWVIFSLLIVGGVLELLFLYLEKENQWNLVQKAALGIDIFGVMFFAMAREPYVNVFLFLFLISKVVIMFRMWKVKTK